MSENSSVGQKHPYHLVDPSPLPFLSSIAGLAMAAGLVFYMHYDTKWLLILGTIGLLTVMFLWWRDVIKESTFQQVHPPVVLPLEPGKPRSVHLRGGAGSGKSAR